MLNGKWTIERLIGQGGMAVVYAARHRNRKRAAIKMLLPELSADAAIRERFLREGYVANSVGHVGAVRVDDDDVTEDGAAYLVMELLEGETVHERWERAGCKLSVKEALAIAEQLLAVLVAAHGVGVIHRDLKPDNLYLTRDGTLKVLDFGIARLRELGQSSRATRTGSVMGTPAFMAPEQARGRWENVDARTDLWAVGALLFTLITGRAVHQAETANETLALACMQRAAPIRSVDPSVPAPIAELIDRVLSYENEARFPDAASMRQTLRDSVRAVFGDKALPPLAMPGVDLTSAIARASGSDSSPSSHDPTSGEAKIPSESRGTPTPAQHDCGRGPVVSGAVVEDRSDCPPQAQRPPTELTAALSNNFGPTHAKRKRLIAGAVALVVVLSVAISWIARSTGGDANGTRAVPTNAPLLGAQPGGSAPGIRPTNRFPTPIDTATAPIQLAPDDLAKPSLSITDAGIPARSKKLSLPTAARHVGSQVQKAPQSTHAAQGNDPMSFRR